MVDLPGHNDDPGEGASGYVVSIGKYLRPNHGYCLLSHFVSLNLLTHAAKVVLGLVLEIGQFRDYFLNLPTFRKHPTDERPEALGGQFPHGDTRLRRPWITPRIPDSVIVSLESRKPGEVIITTSYGKFKVNRPIVGLSLKILPVFSVICT